MRAGAGLDGEGSTKLGQHPGLGSGQTLQVLLRSSGHSDLVFWKKTELFSILSKLRNFSQFNTISVTLNFPLKFMARVVVGKDELEEFIGSRREV